MRNADNVLGIIRERGQKGLVLEDLYRQLYNPELYLEAYGNIYSNKGAMTPGATSETVDGMSMAKIEKLILDLRSERYHWTPVRRVNIPKSDNQTRPLGLPTWSDKLLQEVMRRLLEAYYEPQFSPRSHGFRPERGCHTALGNVTSYWTGTKWFIEGDISKYFDTINHEVLLTTLRQTIKDNRFIRLIENLLKAGYLEDWKYNATLSGTPQGGIISPLLANIYLDKFDKYVEKVLIPEYTKGDARRYSKKYEAMRMRIVNWRKKGRNEEADKLWVELQKLPSVDPNDPDYRRLRYVRYADDFLIGLIGTKNEALEIKAKIKEWLKVELKLELSETKTLITHATTQTARFLGYEIKVQQADDKHTKQGHRGINGRIGLRVPIEVVEKKCARYMQKGVAASRNELILDDDFTIIRQYQAEYQGIVNYYMLAYNVSWFHRLRFVMQTSLLRTLAAKHKTTLMAMYHKYRAVTQTPYGPMKCLKMVVEREKGKKPLVAHFGGIPLRHQKTAVLRDIDVNQIFKSDRRKELIQRLLADECELCGAKEKVEIHHIRKLADLKAKGRKEKPIWVQKMAARRRKTLAVCSKCHDSITFGKLVTKVSE